MTQQEIPLHGGNTSTVVRAPVASRSAASRPTVVGTTCSSGHDARTTMAAGVSGPYPQSSSDCSSIGRAADRNTAIVVRWAANDRTASPSGMGVRPPSRVSTTDCATCGTVSSSPAAAAAAPSDDTPGTISDASPRAWQNAICSWVAPYTDGSPECSRATTSPSASARS